MNFRSRAQVLDFCNDIFYKIMSPDLGRVAYDRDAALYYGAKNYDENAKGFKPELLLLDEKDELLSETKNLTKGQMEAHMIATRIADMKQHVQVTDKESGQLRPLRYSDIVILLRSLKDYGTDFVQVLQGAGIPAYVESSTGYFSASEVQTVLAMLRILDNPYQDIPMAAVLRSPWWDWMRKKWHRFVWKIRSVRLRKLQCMPCRMPRRAHFMTFTGCIVSCGKNRICRSMN